jgi:NAD(P)H dehydrogenase (quinone)
MTTILIVCYSDSGNTAKMAKTIADGVRQTGAEALVRAIPPTSYNSEANLPTVPDTGPPYVTVAEVESCDGMIVGSPTHFGSISAPVAQFFSQIASVWLSGNLIDKPAGVFTSTGSLHGGQELVLQQLMVPLMHMGMVIVGLPYSNNELNDTESGGTPYGPSHWSRKKGVERDMDNDETILCKALGSRVATISQQLKSTK